MTDHTTVFAVLHHMHLAGRHMTTTADLPDGTTRELLDAPFDFNDQRFIPLGEGMALPPRTEVHARCDFDNDADYPLTPAERTGHNQMCISYRYRYRYLALLNDDTEPNTSLGFEVPRFWCLH